MCTNPKGECTGQATKLKISMINMTFPDKEAPVISCPTNQTIHTDPSQDYATVVYSDPQVTDNSGDTPTITCDVVSGSQFVIGKHEVICQALDPSGNLANCSFTVTIEGNSSGFISCGFCLLVFVWFLFWCLFSPLFCS